MAEKLISRIQKLEKEIGQTTSKNGIAIVFDLETGSIDINDEESDPVLLSKFKRDVCLVYGNDIPESKENNK
jgi:rRNA processing protein Krr1/Pno1